MFNEFKKREEFYEKYLEFYIERFVYTAIDIEEDKDTSKIRQKKRNLLEAFKYVSNIQENVLNVWDIRDLGDLVNKDEDVPVGFRKIQVSAGAKGKFIPVRPFEIIPRLYTLIDSYTNIWCDLNPFEREAMFHIELMRIHPFEDGNKRTAKTLLNRNLIHQKMAPVIISESETDQYYEFINNRDYLGFAAFLEKKSIFELTNMVGLYKMLNQIPVDVEGNDLKLRKSK